MRTADATIPGIFESLERLREFEYDLFDRIVGKGKGDPVPPQIPSKHAKLISDYMREFGVNACSMVEDDEFEVWLEERR